MAEFIIECVIVEHRLIRLIADSEDQAKDEVARYHMMHDSTKLGEFVLITKCEEDK